jgi:tetratricopeptide (TPR) repeat protein
MENRKRARRAERPGADRTAPNTAPRPATPARARHVVLLLVLLLATAAAYRPAWHGAMLWDDEAHVTPGQLQSGEGLRRIWSEVGATQQYYPLTHSLFWVQHKLWGHDTTGYHLVSILLHGLSAFLLSLILRDLRIPGAPLAALIFALHPVHVESVAWISELKNTLSGVFYLAAALAYVRFDQTRTTRRYALALALFLAALLSKTVTATLPAALLVVFWWRRGTVSWSRDVRPLAPLLALGTAAGLHTAWVERTVIGAQGADFDFTIVERCLIAARAIWFYLAKLLWPANLMFNYPRWEISQTAWWLYLFPVLLAALAGVLWWLRHRSRAPLAAMLILCGTLFPVLGFFNVYPFRYSFVADHFQYLASIPIIALCAAGINTMLQPLRVWNRFAAAVAALIIAVPLGLLTWRQSQQYVDIETLYRTTLSRNPDSWMAHGNLGTLMLDTDPKTAMEHLRAALRINPNLPQNRVSLGYGLQTVGRYEEALEEYREAMRLHPGFAEAYNNACSVLEMTGRLEEAVQMCEEALRLRPDYAKAHNNLGSALRALGRMDEALVHLNEALRLNPEFPQAHNNLGGVLQATSRLDDAVRHFREAVRLSPGYSDARFNLAYTLQLSGKATEAIPHYQEVLRRNPADASAHTNLGAAFETIGRLNDAAAHYDAALRAKPDSTVARNNLARVKAALASGRSPG